MEDELKVIEASIIEELAAGYSHPSVNNLAAQRAVRILFGEADISHFEILSAFRLTKERHLLAQTGHVTLTRTPLGAATSPPDLSKPAQLSPFPRGTLSVSVGACTFG